MKPNSTHLHCVVFWFIVLILRNAVTAINQSHLKQSHIFKYIEYYSRNRNCFLDFLVCILTYTVKNHWLSYTIYLSKISNMKLFCRKEHRKVKSINQSLLLLSRCI